MTGYLDLPGQRVFVEEHGAGHGAPLQRAAVVNRIILDFLADPDPERMIALGSLADT